MMFEQLTNSRSWMTSVAAAGLLSLTLTASAAGPTVGPEATSWTLSSSSFAYDSSFNFVRNSTDTGWDPWRLTTTDPGTIDAVGTFTINNPSGLFPAIGNPGDWKVVAARITARMEDGDSALGAFDYNNLAVVVGKGSATPLRIPGLYLNGFPNAVVATATNSTSLLGNDAFGVSLATMLAGSGSAVNFFIDDINEGMNNLFFYKSQASVFKLEFDLQRALTPPPAPVPVPGGLLLLGSALLTGVAIRRRS